MHTRQLPDEGAAIKCCAADHNERDLQIFRCHHRRYEFCLGVSARQTVCVCQIGLRYWIRGCSVQYSRIVRVSFVQYLVEKIQRIGRCRQRLSYWYQVPGTVVLVVGRLYRTLTGLLALYVR